MANDSSSRPVAGIILAAGTASRMGATKALLPWQGQPLIRHIVEVARASHLQQLVVVTGHDAGAVGDALRSTGVELVHNDRYREGMSGSLRVGIQTLHPHIAAALVMLTDQPLLTVDVINLLVERYWHGNSRIVAPCADGRRGNPVLFDRTLFEELQVVSGDQGARAILRTYADEIASVAVMPYVLEDVDTREMYDTLVARYGGSDRTK